MANKFLPQHQRNQLLGLMRYGQDPWEIGARNTGSFIQNSPFGVNTQSLLTRLTVPKFIGSDIQRQLYGMAPVGLGIGAYSQQGDE